MSDNSASENFAKSEAVKNETVKTETAELRERLTALEMVVMHLQQETETLGKVVLDQQKQLDQYRERIDKLGNQVERALMEPEERDPLVERPPHY